MTNQGLSNRSRSAPHAQRLTPNEKAVLDSVSLPILKSLLTSLWRVKLRLQFTGWLQYMPSAILSLVLFFVAGVAGLLGASQVREAFVVGGNLGLAVFLFDLVTVKFRMRFHERLPKRNDDLGPFDLLRARRSCRSFQTRKLTSVDRSELMDRVRLHTSEPLIGEAPIRLEYVSAPLTVWPTVNATEFLVAIAPKKYNRLAVIDVGRSLQKVVVDATRMGLGTCWIGPGADQTSVARCLGDRFNPKEDHIICVCAVGYRSWYLPLFLRIFNLQFHRRLPLSSLFFADPQMQQSLDLEAYPFSRFGRTFEVCQWSPSSYNGQTTRCVAVMDRHAGDGARREENKPHLSRFDFYAVTESRYYAAVAVGIWCADWELGCEALGISGHMASLSAQQRSVQTDQASPQVPRYDVSWVLDENL